MPSDNLYQEIITAELAAYRKLETWGASIFFGAIALTARQFLVWDSGVDPLVSVKVKPAMVIFPALLGLAAFIFLRINNYRSHEAIGELYKVAKKREKKAAGWLGLVISVLPLLFGQLASWSLANNISHKILERSPWMWGVTIVSAGVVVGMLWVHYQTRKPTNNRKNGVRAKKTRKARRAVSRR